MTTLKQTLSGVSAFVALLWISVPVWGQSIDTSKLDSTIYDLQLDEIIISAGKYEQSPQSVGRNVSVISKEEIRKSIYANAGDLLAQQQSIHMIGSGQTPGSLQQGFIRNANSNHSVVMIDGVRISDPSTNNNSIDLSELSLIGVERIEIVRGSHSTLYGSSAIGGVINIITQKASKSGFNVNVETGHGRFGDDTYSTDNRFFANYTLENGIYANVGADYQYVNGMDATVDTTGSADQVMPRDQDDFRKLDLMGKLGYSSTTYDLYASYKSVDQRSDVDQGAYQDDDNAYTDFRRNLFKFGAGTNLFKNILLDFNSAYSNLNRDFVDDSSLVSPEGVYDGIYIETNGEGTLWENELKSVMDTDNVRLTVGASASRQTMSTRDYVYSRSEFGIYESETNLDSLNLSEIIYNGYAHSDINGGLVSPRIESFSLVIGARYVNHDEFGTHVTYEINPKVNIGASALLYGTVTTGFNAPSLYQLYEPSSGGSGFTNRGNRGLNPEKSISWEMGWKQELSPKFSFSLSAFKTKVSDKIEYVYLWDADTEIPNLKTAFPDSDYLGDTFINASEQNIIGLEASASAYITPKLNVKGNISLTRSELRFGPDDIDPSYTGGNHVQIYESGVFVTEYKEVDGLPRRPSINGFVSLAYQATDDLRLKIDSKYVGSRDDVYYSEELGPYGALDRTNLSGYNLTDLSIRYTVSDAFSMNVKSENIFDTDYHEIRGYRSRGRGYFVKLQYQF